MHPFASLQSTLLDGMMDLHRPRFTIARDDTPRLAETNDGRAYCISLSAPGVKPSDLKCSAENGTLKIEGETKTTNRTHSVRWATVLPRDADTELATASTADGIITLTLPKKESAAPLSITVSSEMTDTEDHTEYHTEEYVFNLSAPGLAAADVEVVAARDDGVLTIKGETKRTGARMAKSVRLPRDADLSLARATHIDGLLTVSVPKKAPAEAKHLVVNEKAHDEDFEMA